MKNIVAMDMHTAEQTFSDYDYALLYRASSIDLVRADTAALTAAALDADCSEACLFSEDGELHLFRDEDGSLRCVRITDQDVPFLDRTYELGGQYAVYGKKLIVRQYLEEDEDGQMMVGATRLVAVE